ncbi:MAG: NRAMP family divalent metal transporter [Thermoguttaceae bacterium]
MILLAVLGPGIITMVADNDAGGISTYAQTGARYGFSFLWVFFILIPMAYYVQEMTVRLGAVTKRGHAEAIFDAFGSFWGWFSIFDLALINWLTLVTEYIGMTAAMRMFGIPEWITYGVVSAILMGVVVTGKYWTFEKVTLFFCLFNFVYIPAAFWAMQTDWAPAWGKVGQGFYNPWPEFSAAAKSQLIMMIMANIGTTITPWQIFFQQSAVVDKGMDVRDIRFGKFDTFAGSFFTGLVAIFIIIATGAAFYYHPKDGTAAPPGATGLPVHSVEASAHAEALAEPVARALAEPVARARAVSPGESAGNPSNATESDEQAAANPYNLVDARDAGEKIARLLPSDVGHWARFLFAIGLFDAGFLGALCISLSTSWAVGEVFGWAHSLNKSVKEAPWFYVVYLGTLLSAGSVVLLATRDTQSQITIFVQVVAVTLLPAALTFLILLLNDEPLMGRYVNSRWQNIVNWGIVLFVIVVSTMFGISVLFGGAS